MKKKTFILVALLIPCFLGFYSQDKKIPEYYGIYIHSNEQLYELSAQEIAYARPRGDCAEAEHVFGINPQSVKDVNNRNLYIIIFKEGMSADDIKLTKLHYVRALPLTCRPLVGRASKISTRINMWVKEKDVEFRVGPVEGKQKMYKIAPREPLASGVYAINTGCFRRVMGNIFSIQLSAAEKGIEAYVFSVNSGKVTSPSDKTLNTYEKESIESLDVQTDLEQEEINLEAKKKELVNLIAQVQRYIKDIKNADFRYSDPISYDSKRREQGKILRYLESAIESLSQANKIANLLSKTQLNQAIEECKKDLEAAERYYSDGGSGYRETKRAEKKLKSIWKYI